MLESLLKKEKGAKDYGSLTKKQMKYIVHMIRQPGFTDSLEEKLKNNYRPKSNIS